MGTSRSKKYWRIMYVLVFVDARLYNGSKLVFRAVLLDASVHTWRTYLAYILGVPFRLNTFLYFW